jgi:hypothetical protein
MSEAVDRILKQVVDAFTNKGGTMSENDNKQEDNKADEIDEILCLLCNRCCYPIEDGFPPDLGNYKGCAGIKATRKELARVIEKEFTQDYYLATNNKAECHRIARLNEKVKQIADLVRGSK